ncbi:hypothetical protein V8J88_09640 [Massilia sp. W12]|uniref:hypothetical protein n=1 Tax=Massilia sp. W12 TaxID=3126507 RepID=UPI0030D5649D
MASTQHYSSFGAPIRQTTGLEHGLCIPEIGLKDFVTELAARHRISAVKTRGDQWAETVTRLAGDEVQTDAVEDLLIALKKAQCISNGQMAQLLANYLREKARI